MKGRYSVHKFAHNILVDKQTRVWRTIVYKRKVEGRQLIASKRKDVSERFKFLLFFGLL